MTRRVGRPSRLDGDDGAKLERDLCEALGLGMPLDRAALAVGVDPEQVREWVRRGNAEPGTRYEEFSRAITRARAVGEWELLQKIKTSPDGKERRALEWILERTRREDYGAQLDIVHRVRAEVEAEQERVIGVLRARLDPATFELVVAALASPDDGGGTPSPGGDAGGEGGGTDTRH